MFSNDTLAFFVKIDTTKKPRFPIDREYYLDKPIEGIDLALFCYTLNHKKNDVVLFPSNEPMFIVDGIRMSGRAIENSIQPADIAAITVYKDSNATKMGGPEAKNGLVYITSKSFARSHYWTYFKSKSASYAESAPDLAEESKLVYILNNKILTKGFEKDLFDINDTNFIDLGIIGKNTLKKNFKILDKLVGVVIRTR